MGDAVKELVSVLLGTVAWGVLGVLTYWFASALGAIAVFCGGCFFIACFPQAVFGLVKKSRS